MIFRIYIFCKKLFNFLFFNIFYCFYKKLIIHTEVNNNYDNNYENNYENNNEYQNTFIINKHKNSYYFCYMCNRYIYDDIYMYDDKVFCCNLCRNDYNSNLIK